MKEKFQAVVNDQITIPLTSDQAIPRTHTDTTFRFTEKNRTVHADILQQQFSTKTYRIKIHGSIYDVRLMDDLDILIDEMGLTKKTDESQSDLIAPMPGLIHSVLAKEGQDVQAGEGLLILEAMKMENKLTAQRNGIIKKIHVQKGHTVEKGKLLIEFEKPEENE